MFSIGYNKSMQVTDQCLMGIDYGSRRVGVALSPAGSSLAFPHEVYENNKDLISDLKYEINFHRVEVIIVGKSMQLNGTNNKIQAEAENFVKKLSRNLTHIDFEWQDERFSSQNALSGQGENDLLDASAATKILQSWIDKNKSAKV